MSALIQRVTTASVAVDGQTAGEIERGFLVLLGVTHDDGEAEAVCLARKVAGLRLFEDDAGKFNRSLHDVGGAVLVVSQFTLYGDARKGRRPSFVEAARPERPSRCAGASKRRYTPRDCRLRPASLAP